MAKTVLKIVLSLGLSAFFLWSAFQSESRPESVDLEQVYQVLLETNIPWLIASPILVILATFPRAWRWQILMSSVTPDVPTRKVAMAILMGYAGNNIVPRAGEVARIWAIDRSPAKLSGLAATVAVERLIDLVTLMLLFAGTAIYLRGHLATVFPRIEGMAVSASLLVFGGTVLVIGIAVCGDRLLDAAEGKYPRLSQSKISVLIRSFLQGMESVRTPGNYASIVTWTVLLNLCYMLSLFLPFLAFGFVERYALGPADAFAVLTIATIGIVIPTPGGAGTYHYFCSRALSGLYQIPLDEALAFATVVHGLVYISFLILGGPSLISLLWNRRGAEN